MKKQERKIYPQSIRFAARQLFVEEEWTLQRISKHYDSHPTVQTVSNWAHKKDEEGKTWFDLRRERAEMKYVEMSPRSMASKILGKLWSLLNDPNIEATKFSDALWKMQKSIQMLADPRLQMPVLYQFLEDYTEYCRRNHPNLVGEAFIASLRDFKNHIRARIDESAPAISENSEK